ncbi:hypothetical protein [Paramaledivibacter caminithermalis]|jgi:hypothetical protein|uniref:Uncharacterized protein n=1 Tax=Paramaledivibacter caminithermalis (strain DSM 15212 / CIP 107654 / DViRD3) TaxID=1121301 RepID=A0A1M6SAH2_PARC5|nr:hypothetical protein [Paramaledivibacter caminithermalis]SHK41548.1 hypothetical protein SAMN02745912_03240 [Paramaledivibacter caminithermalis DSM 15212]
MDKWLIRTTLEGLIFTAKEKKCVLGDDAKEDINKIKEIYEELVMFWDLDESLIDEFEKEVEN